MECVSMFDSSKACACLDCSNYGYDFLSPFFQDSSVVRIAQIWGFWFCRMYVYQYSELVWWKYYAISFMYIVYI